MKVSVLEFRLHEDLYCFNTELVEYVYDLADYERLKAFDPAVLGLGRYNDDAMLLVDTCRLFCDKPLESGGEKSVIVIRDDDGGIYGMVVDEIVKIEDVEKADIALELNSEEMIINHYKEKERIVNEIVPLPLLKSRGVPGLKPARQKKGASSSPIRHEAGKLDVLRFRVGKNHFAVPSAQVKEVVEKESALFALPEGPRGGIRGAVAVRDEVVEVLNFLSPEGGTDIIVLDLPGCNYGIEADEIFDIDLFEKSRLAEVEDSHNPVEAFYNDGKEVVAVVGVQRLLKSLGLQAAQKARTGETPSRVGSSEKIGYMLFRVGDEVLAAPVSYVRQVIETVRLSKTSTSALTDGLDHVAFLATWNHMAVQVLRIDGWIDHALENETDNLTLFLQEGDNAVGVMVDEVLDILFVDPFHVSRSTENRGVIDGAVVTDSGVVPVVSAQFLLRMGSA